MTAVTSVSFPVDVDAFEAALLIASVISGDTPSVPLPATGIVVVVAALLVVNIDDATNNKLAMDFKDVVGDVIFSSFSQYL